MAKVWVDGKVLSNENPKSKLWEPPPKLAPVYWGTCAPCGRTIYKGDPVWTVGEFILTVCYNCYDDLGEGCHLDCAGLMLPGIALEG